MPEPLHAEVIAIGDELTTGQRLDTNSRWLAERLTELGARVAYHTTVADDLQENADAYGAAIERADLVLSTGGLGPTADDLARDALAAAAGVGMVEHEESLKHIRALYRARNIDMPPQNARQAQFPEGARPIPNPNGTAPGIDFEANRSERSACRVFAMPGVPAEMRPMWADWVAPEIAKLSGGRATRHHLVKCFGVGESTLEAMLGDLIARKRDPLVGITASLTTLTLRVTASGADDSACRSLMAPTLEHIRAELGDLIFAESTNAQREPDLHDTLCAMLRDHRECVATTEAMTGGLLAESLGRLDPGGDVLVAANIAPRSYLGAEEEFARVQRDADQFRIRVGAEWGLAVGARPNSGESPLFVSLAGERGAVSKEVRLLGRELLDRSLAAKHAMNLLRLELLRGEGGSRT